MDRATLHAPRYTYAEVARYVGIHPQRVSRWLKYSYSYQEDRYVQPPVVEGRPVQEFASFADLLEVRLINKLIVEHGFTLQRIRRAADEAREIWGPYPFMNRRVFTDRRRLVVDAEDGGAKAFLELLSGGQLAIHQVVGQLYEELAFDEEDDPVAWSPLGMDRLVEIAPQRAFGYPVVRGRRLKTSVVYDMFLAEGGDKGRVCWWFEIDEEELQDAVTWEEQLKRRRKAA